MVGLVLISHSPEIAEGTATLVRQMAGEVEVTPVGGTSDGSLGTDPDGIQAAIEGMNADEVLVFVDIGSAVLSAEMVLEMLSPDLRENVRIADAPFVEGAFAAGVLAQAGSDAAECEAAAMESRTESKLHGET